MTALIASVMPWESWKIGLLHTRLHSVWHCLFCQLTPVQVMKPKDFAQQINLNMDNCWGIVRALVDLCMKQEDGKYLLVKGPQQAAAAPVLCARGRLPGVRSPITVCVCRAAVLHCRIFVWDVPS